MVGQVHYYQILECIEFEPVCYHPSNQVYGVYEPRNRFDWDCWGVANLVYEWIYDFHMVLILHNCNRYQIQWRVNWVFHHILNFVHHPQWMIHDDFE